MSRDAVEPISLYDPSDHMIGRVYPRRAKQLVLKGKAVWLDEDRTLRLITDIPSAKNLEEERTVTDDTLYPNNGRPEPPASGGSAPDALLLYQAKQNVRDKKNLIRHTIAFAAVCLLLLVVYEEVVSDAIHPAWRAVDRTVQSLHDVLPYIPEDQWWPVNEATWQLEASYTYNYVPNVWYVFVGALLAWGGWILFRFIKRAAFKFRAASARKSRPDPVLQEYRRLKNLAADEAP